MELRDLVEPGGYLQWVDADPLKNRVVTPDGVDSKATQGFMDLINQKWTALDRR